MDLQCPYCEKGQEVCHDDGFGYEQDVKHAMECGHCGKSFVFLTAISFHYEPEKADCLNDDQHHYKISNTFPNEFSSMECTMCGDRRELTDDERKEYNIGTKDSYFQSLQS